LFFCKEFVSF